MPRLKQLTPLAKPLMPQPRLPVKPLTPLPMPPVKLPTPLLAPRPTQPTRCLNNSLEAIKGFRARGGNPARPFLLPLSIALRGPYIPGA